MSPQVAVLDKSQFDGAVVVNVIALISALALLSLAFRVIWLACNPIFGRDRKQVPTAEAAFFRTRMGVFAICLLIGNFFVSIAGVIGVSWLAQGKAVQGPMCTTQAVFMATGNISTAYFTVAIAVHSFTSLVLRYRHSVWFGILAILTGTGFALAISLFPLSPVFENGAMYGPGDITCGVQSKFAKALFYHHLLPIFVASILSAILYSVIFLVLRGTLVIHGGIRLNLHPDHRKDDVVDNPPGYPRFILAIARTMLWYPIAYVIFLLPYSITRLLIISGFDIPKGISMFAFSCWYMLGIVNVLLLYNTFRVVAPLLQSSNCNRSSEEFFPSMNVPPRELMLPTTPLFAAQYAVRSTLSPIADHPSSHHPFDSIDDRRNSSGGASFGRSRSYSSSQDSHAIGEPVTPADPIAPLQAARPRSGSVNSSKSTSSSHHHPHHHRSTSSARSGPPVRPPRLDNLFEANTKAITSMRVAMAKGKWATSHERQSSTQAIPRDVHSRQPSLEDFTRDNSIIAETTTVPIDKQDMSWRLAQYPSESFRPLPRPSRQSSQASTVLRAQASLTAVLPARSAENRDHDDTSDLQLPSSLSYPIIRALPPTPSRHPHDQDCDPSSRHARPIPF